MPDLRRYGQTMIDHDSDIPVYLQLAEILRDKIRRGELQPRRPIPSIRTLQQTYEVSDGTVKKAVQVLRDEGLVRTVLGRGVYVVGLASVPTCIYCYGSSQKISPARLGA